MHERLEAMGRRGAGDFARAEHMHGFKILPSALSLYARQIDCRLSPDQRRGNRSGIAQIGLDRVNLADIAEVAGQEGAKILQTLAARAESMRSQALSADRASAGSKSTTMVVPIALLGAGFLILLIFPMVYRIIGVG